MENAYYYFFSAVPQVLAGVMALFGVFVLFKLQSLSNELSEIVKTLWQDFKYSNIQETSDISEIRSKLSVLLYDAFNIKSFKALADYFKTFDDKIFSKYPNYTAYQKRFKTIYNTYEDILKRTIFATTFTGIIIIICLALLPFAKFLSCNYVLVFSLFTIIIICVSIVFCLLITILKKSLK